MTTIPCHVGTKPGKRIRLNVEQSKYGCFTCKSRRIKCDEGRPFCERCRRSHRACEGYPSRALAGPSSLASKLSPSGIPSHMEWLSAEHPKYALFTGCWHSPEQDRLSQIGCEILIYDLYGGGIGMTRATWTGLLRQINHDIPSVHAAAAALGAIYESRLLSKPCNDRHSNADAHYVLALRKVQEEVSSIPHGPIPILLACLFLVSAELLQRRQQNALMHLRGALHLLTGTSTPKADTGHEIFESVIGDDAQVEDLVGMYYALDLQKAIYALGQPPELPVFRLNSPEVPLQPRQFDLEAMRFLQSSLHACYHFTAFASTYKYLSPSALAPDLLIEQGRHIGALSHSLAALSQLVKSYPKNPAQYLILRAQCLCAIIYASTILSPFETSYDLHLPQFRQIVDSLCLVLSTCEDMSRSPFSHFRIIPAMIPPLFFTALKCRSPELRRTALARISILEAEGPWEGRLHAAVGLRAMQIEEIALQSSCNEHIPERARLHGCGIDAEAGSGKALDHVTVMFSRCVGVEEMLIGHVAWDDHQNWDIWDEEVAF